MPCALAGLWERWSAPTGETVQSYTILTTTPNDLVAPLHDRMPVIIEPADFGDWLDLQMHDPARVQRLLRPFPTGPMEAFAVSRRVNATTHDDAACIEPMSADGEAGDPSLFD